ncbi:MAG: FAD-dependent oxidoreductase [Comamonas sp.]
MTLIQNALIIGGGIGGLCAAIELRKQGIAVDVAELRADGSADGAGITISSPTLRALRRVGVVDEVLAQAGWWNFIDLCAADGSLLQTLPMAPAEGAEELPCAAGVMRPTLAAILTRAARDAGARLRLGLSFEQLEQDANGVEVRFTDGSRGRYDLVIGADGVHSRVRPHVLPDVAGPVFTGQGSWRAVVPRTREHSTMFLGEHTKAGLNPVSRTESYLFVLDRREHADFIEPERWPALLAELLGEFGGAIAEIRRGLLDGTLAQHHLLYRPLLGHIVSAPWHRGRIVLLGDAVHATTPHLASGAGIAAEGALILAEELGRRHSLEGALTAYAGRHYDRARLVVGASAEMGRLEREGGDKDAHRAVMLHAMDALRAAI